MWAKRTIAGLIAATVFWCSVVWAGTPESHFVDGNTLLAKGDLSGALKAYAAAVTADRSNQQYAQQFMLVRADEERFTTPEEFAADEELLIGSQTGTTNFYVAVYDVLDGDEANPRIKLLENFGAAVQALIAGDVDMVLMDAASSRGYIGANPAALKTVGDALGTEEFGFIFTPGSDLVASFNAAIETMADDGYLEYLNNRWFFLYDPTAE